jgi:protease-4
LETPSEPDGWTTEVIMEDQVMNDKVESKQTVSGTDVAGLALLLAPLLRGASALVDAQRSDMEDRRQWRWVSRGALVLILGMLLAPALRFAGVTALWSSGADNGSVVAVIPVVGAIGEKATADQIVPQIQDACASPEVGAVVLHIRSEGGSPSQAHRIARAVERCRTGMRKPVTAVIQGMGASGAYLIAVSADRVVADDYAFVGSIGAYLATMDVSEAAERAGVKQRLFASGEHKGMLSPWRSLGESQEAVAQALANDVAAVFRAYVEQRRGEKLAGQGTDLFSGRVWVGAEAKRLGLIDDVGVLEDVLEGEYQGMSPKIYELNTSWRDWVSVDAVADAMTASLIRTGQRVDVR